MTRTQKLAKFIWYNKHEIERICETQDDIYEKTMKIDKWLARTNSKPVREYIKKHFSGQSPSSVSIAQRAIDRILMNCKGQTRLMVDSGKRKTKKSDKKSGGSFDESQLINLEDGDIILSTALRDLTSSLFKVVEKKKHLHTMSLKCKAIMYDALYRILSYKMSIMVAEQMAAIKYDASLNSHTDKVINLWNNLIKDDKRQSQQSSGSQVFPSDLSEEINDKDDIISNRWSHIGFQGEDPGTDFRGMGLLGLVQLEYLSRKPKKLASDLLKRSLNEEHSYPFAIVGINITYNLLSLFRNGHMKHLYYDTGDLLFRNNERTLNLLKTLNDIYVELFLRFDCFWHESKPETIFEFKGLMERFVDIVTIDLVNRNFSLKFIY